ncbi:hypothetical protein D3C73_1138820 [compost metagenome]
MLDTLGNIGDGSGDLTGHKGFATAGGLMVKQNTVTGIHSIRLAVVNRDPVGVHLGHRIG